MRSGRSTVRASSTLPVFRVDAGSKSSHRLVLHAARHDEELALAELDHPVAQVDRETAGEHQEELVLVAVVVPDELALESRELHVLAVQLRDDARAPALGNALELLREVDLRRRLAARAGRGGAQGGPSEGIGPG